MKFDDITIQDYAPLGLVENSLVVNDIKKDEIINFRKISVFKENILFKLWKEQIKLINSM